MDWSALFGFTVSPLELVLRGSVFYWFLFLVFRFVMRRDMGGIGVADVLLVVLVADASQSAMDGGYTSLSEGAVLVGTLIGWNWLLDWAACQWRWVERFVEPQPLLLIRQGRVLHRHLRAEHLTVDDLTSGLRKQGIESPSEVKKAYLEGDGKLSVLTYKRRRLPPPDDGNAVER